MGLQDQIRIPPTQHDEQRKRKRPLPQSESSKATSSMKGELRHTYTCLAQPSISSSMTTTSLSGSKKRPRSTTGTGTGSSLVADALEEYTEKEEGTTMVVASMGGGEGGEPRPLHLHQPSKIRSEMVRRIEKLVSTMFNELDVLLKAEGINRRVMYRWSGPDRKMTVSEGNASYCTWGRELIRQHIEDAVGDVRSTMIAGQYDDSVEAARRLTFQYLTKASERSIIENERSLHSEVMETLGNLWFCLLPHMVLAQRQQFRRLVSRIRKLGNNAGGSSNNSSGLVVPFRCALGFAKLDLSPEALAIQGIDQIKAQLERLLRSDIYECDAYLCLWKVSEALAGLAGFAYLCQEFRLKSLDAEMWRSMLHEEEQARQHANAMDDDYDDDDEDDEYMDDEDEVEEDDRVYDQKDMEKEMGNDMEEVEEEEEEEEEEGKGGEQGLSHQGGIKLSSFAEEGVAADGMRSPMSAGAGTSIGMRSVQASIIPAAAGGAKAADQRLGQMVGAGWSTVDGTGGGTPLIGYGSSPAHSPKHGIKSLGMKSTGFSSERRSSQSKEAVGEGAPRDDVGVRGDRWKTKAALEDGEGDMYTDFMSLHQHEYRRVMTPDFLSRLWTFLKACEPLVVPKGGKEASRNLATGDKEEDAISPARLLFVRARPFLYRVTTLIPVEELSRYLNLVATKFTYAATVCLLEPLLIHEHQSFSTERIGQVLEWTVDFEKGRHLPLMSRMLLPRLQSKTQLERLARRAVAYGISSLPIIDRALAYMPRPAYEAVALHLCQRAVQCWGVGHGAHLVVLRALQGMPSLGLYLKCRGCFLDPVANLVRPLIHQLDPTGELSIGIRLVEGIVGSAVGSMVASLDAHRPGTPERRLRAQHWADFSFAGVRGSQFPPSLLDRLFTNETFLLSVLGAATDHETILDAANSCFAKLAELAHTHPAAVSRPVKALLCTYMDHRTNASLDHCIRKKALEIIEVIKAKGVEIEVMA